MAYRRRRRSFRRRPRRFSRARRTRYAKRSPPSHSTVTHRYQRGPKPALSEEYLNNLARAAGTKSGTYLAGVGVPAALGAGSVLGAAALAAARSLLLPVRV
nr:hypothetical protein [Cressdnaviricota sp.]UOF82577.1 hypothetical protein [Cressdnaviricota sp.]